MKKNQQLKFFKNSRSEYGGDLLKTRKGRRHGRPLSTKESMHMVLRSSRAIGAWSFRHARNRTNVQSIISRFASKYGVKVLSIANAGNHLHLHIKLSNRFAYTRFIRAVTSAIAMSVTGASRWKKVKGKFWDRRPFTRIVVGFKGVLKLRDYIRINQIEGGMGVKRMTARIILDEASRAGPMGVV
jgi:REP element-mobilizing transposase RayT